MQDRMSSRTRELNIVLKEVKRIIRLILGESIRDVIAFYLVSKDGSDFANHRRC